MKRPTSFLPRLVPATAACALCLACGSAATEGAVERADSAGVEIVTNRGDDRPLGWRFESVFAVGGADDGPESFYQVGPSSLAADAGGRLYVLDRGNHRVVVFDGTGRHVRTFGRQGGGPGELQWPTSLVMAPDGTLGVSDIGHHGLVRLTTEGEPLETRAVEGWFGGAIRPFRSGLVVQMRGEDARNAAERLAYLGPDGRTELLSVPGPPTKPVDLGCVQIGGMTQLFAPSLVWAAGPDRLAVAAEAVYRIDLYDEGRPVTSIRRDLPLRPATRALAIQEVGESFRVSFGGGGGCEPPVERVVDERGFADVIPAIRSLAVAPDGTLWVRRFAVRGDPAPVDIFDADGVYQGTLPADAPFPAVFLPGGRIATVERDELDVERVVVYRVEAGTG